MDGNDSLPETEYFKQFFYSYLERNSLILRTFVVPKSKYIESIQTEDYLNPYLEELQKSLPEFFWITEISIPELFWINKRKVGEIITDPRNFNLSAENGVTFIHLPNMLGVFAGEECSYKALSEQRHHPMISLY